MMFEPNDIIGMNEFRLETIKLGTSRSFFVGEIEYRLNEYGNYIDRIYPEIDTRLHRLTCDIVTAQINKRKATRDPLDWVGGNY